MVLDEADDAALDAQHVGDLVQHPQLRAELAAERAARTGGSVRGYSRASDTTTRSSFAYGFS